MIIHPDAKKVSPEIIRSWRNFLIRIIGVIPVMVMSDEKIIQTIEQIKTSFSEK